MNGGTGRVPRMIVGIIRSRASGWALAWAVGEARRRGARLLLVHVFRPPAGPTARAISPAASAARPRIPAGSSGTARYRDSTSAPGAHTRLSFSISA